MKNKVIFFVCTFFLGLPLGQAGNLIEKVEALIKAFEQDTRSMGTIFVQSGSDTFYHAIGFSFEAPFTSNSLSTTFLIASLSKQVTATAVLRLVDLGLLTLDTKVSDLFPELDEKSWIKEGIPATVHHLLSHTAGTPDSYSTRTIKRKLFLTPISMQDILDSIKDLEVTFTPGTHFEYSNTGYLLLGEVVRRKSGLKSYSDFMKREFFHSFPGTSVGRIDSKSIALSYMDDPNGRRVDFINFNGIKERHDSDIFTDGNIYSNVSDMAEWTKRLSRGELLSSAMTKKMFTPVLKSYGYGWMIYKRADGSDLYWHNGSWLGYTGDIYHLPGKDITIVWLRNQEGDSDKNDALNVAILEALGR
jgi:CubicO group peptidase (beta-lactamase class C family)